MTEEKYILDATAGFRMMWFNKNHPNTIYLDEREECNPTMIGDFRNLSKFADESFRLVVFDPPHKVMSDASAKGNVLIHNFGRLRPETWAYDLSNGLKECWRVLKPYGVLIFKWHESDKKLDQIKQYFPSEPLFGQKTNTSKGRDSKPAHTFWICFMKTSSLCENPSRSEKK